MKKFLFLFLLFLFLAACGGDTDGLEPQPASVDTAGITPAGRPTPTNEPAGESTAAEVASVPPTLTAIPTTVPTVAATESAPAGDGAPETASTEEPASAPTEIVMDGQNPNGSFYRGLDSAPITMIDYSDFL